MKKHTVFGRFLIPVMIALLLLPPLCGFLFYQSARRYAYKEAVVELQNLQNRIVPIIHDCFTPQAQSDLGDDEADPVKLFLSKAGPLASQMGGNAQMMILAGEMQVIYPRDEQLRAMAAPLAEEFIQYIQSNPLEEDTAISLKTKEGESYLVNFYQVPITSQRIKYVIVYCPSSRIGSWVEQTTVFVFGIAMLLAMLVLVILWVVAKSITQPIHRLCTETERIGQGNFSEIEPAFSIKELENLRCSMNRMAQQLRTSDEIQKNFFQNVSHELRNPLMSISGYAQGIETGVFPSSTDAAHTILEESVRLTELVNSLLTLSRLESGSQNTVICPIPIAETVEDCLDRMYGLAFRKKVTLTLLPFPREMAAYASEELLSDVLENLLTNAIRYARQTVTIHIRTENNLLAISVADDGEGIQEKDMPHLFERCYKGKGGHFGIGLAIAHSAAEKMGGFLQAANGENQGAVFTLFLKT